MPPVERRDSAMAAPRSVSTSRASDAESRFSSVRSSRSVARRMVVVRANWSHARANETKLVRPPWRWAASIGQMPPRLSVYAPTTIGWARIPSSIASRVRAGRQSMALLRLLIGSRVFRTGAHGTRARPVATRGERILAVRLGLHIGYWGLGMTADEQLELVLEAERLGYDSVWTAEAYGSDAATILAWLAQATSRIKLGSAIFQMPGRSAAVTAMTAGKIDQLSAGRMLLGIGWSGPQGAEGWHGQRFARQLQRTREYVAVVRMALARERVEVHGETLELPLPDGPGKALKLTIAPVQDRIPIYLAAIGPKNSALAGEIADGWIPTLLDPGHLSTLREQLDEGAARAGRSLNGDFDIAPSVQVFVHADVDAARDALRPFIALYVGGMGSRKQNFYNQLVQRYGFEDAAREVQDLYLDGKKDEAAAALPSELIDRVAIVGPKDVARERIAAYRDAGVGTLGVSPFSFTKKDRLEQLRLV